MHVIVRSMPAATEEVRLMPDGHTAQLKVAPGGGGSRPSCAKPFLKWAGGKQRLLGQFEAFFPAVFSRYLEPFVGGAAVFFHLANAGRLPRQVLLVDHNEELINTYRAVRDRLSELMDILAVHQERHGPDYYYHVRSLDRQGAGLGDVERAARTIYLNRTCYNGLYRVNSRGHFNVPLGSYKNPTILDRETLLAASRSLRNVKLEVRDFRTLVELGQRGDYLYFDPPYHPLSKTASFTGYTAGNFREGDQRDLAEVFARLSEKGCLCMLSNSYTPLILELYRGFRVETVAASRAINSDGNGRGTVQEVVVLNY